MEKVTDIMPVSATNDCLAPTKAFGKFTPAVSLLWSAGTVMRWCNTFDSTDRPRESAKTLVFLVNLQVYIEKQGITCISP